MPRCARYILPEIPYHITQRGNRGDNVFFEDSDRSDYLKWLEEYSEKYGLDILAYCLMTNHIHIVALPHAADSLGRTLHSLHTRYSRICNWRHGWTGHLWQGRFFSTSLDGEHLVKAVRYVERNPVRARMVARASDYRWSSAAFHLGMREDSVIRSDSRWGAAIEDWEYALGRPEDEEFVGMIRKRTHVGFPCGDEEFVDRVCSLAGRHRILRSPGRPRKG